MKKSIVLFLAVVVAATALLSCATFKSDIGGKFTDPPQKNYNAEGVSVLFIFAHQSQVMGWDAIPKLENKYQRISGFDDFFQDALGELTNIKSYSTFTEYATDVNEPERRALKDSLVKSHDFVMKIRFKREKSFAKYFLGSIVSTGTITLLPVPYSNSYSVSLDLYNSDGRLVKSYSRSASLTKWVQAALLFLYPFHPEKRKKEEIYVEFLHDLFRQIETEKVLLKFGSQ